MKRRKIDIVKSLGLLARHVAEQVIFEVVNRELHEQQMLQ